MCSVAVSASLATGRGGLSAQRQRSADYYVTRLFLTSVAELDRQTILPSDAGCQCPRERFIEIKKASNLGNSDARAGSDKLLDRCFQRRVHWINPAH